MTRTEVFCDRCNRKVNNFRECTVGDKEYALQITDPYDRKETRKYVLCQNCAYDLIDFMMGKVKFDFTPLNSEVDIYNDWLKNKNPDEPDVW